MEKKHIITIDGKPGSGKSTTANLVATILGYQRYSAGSVMREMAKERSITLAEMGKIAEQDPTIDNIIDGKMREVGEAGDSLVIDARLAFYFVPHAFKVYLDLDLETAVRRIYANQTAERSAQGEPLTSFEAFHDSIIARYESEQRRYEMLYGINPSNLTQYNLIVDTSVNEPQAVADQIVQSYETWLGE